MSDFALDVSKWVAKAKMAPEKVVRSVTIKLWSAVIKGSPVDTGRFRGNWFASGGTPSSEVSETDDKTGATSISSATQVVVGIADWTNMTLTNNLPYAEVIEFGGYKGMFGYSHAFVGPTKAAESTNTINGFSKQAPSGVVRVNVARFQQLINEEAAKQR